MTKHFPTLLLSSFMAVFFTQACSCDPSTGESCEDPNVINDVSGMCCAAPADTGSLCPVGEICDGTVEGAVTFNPTLDPADPCSVVCNACIPNLLNPGILSQQLDVTQTAAGDVVLSGYSPGDVVLGFKYGDLVFGEYDATTDEVTWTPIDGVPEENEGGDQSFSPDGWRDGIYAAGDDVGRYSSIVANGENLIISYEDTRLPVKKNEPLQEHFRLKVATRVDGTWTSHVVDDMDDAATSTSGGALYTSIALDAANLPVIAYGVRLQAADVNSQPTGWVRIARASVEFPTVADDWTIVDLGDTLVEVGCLQGDGMCHADQTCVSIGTSGRGHCVPTTGTNDCTSTCTTSQVCDSGTCAEKRTLGDLVDAQGLYNNLVRTTDGFALAFYDRSVTRQVGSGTGHVDVSMAGMPPMLVNGNRLLRDAGDTFTAAMVGKPIRIAGVLGLRSVVSIQSGNELTFSGDPVGADVNGAGLTFYDSTSGTVWGMRFPDADTDWSDNTRFPIEGYQVSNTLYGDCGVSTSLFVDSTDVWHVTFVDGTYERLRYVRIAAGATTVAANARTTVDDGYPGVNRPSDRPMLGGERRLVGDGASVVVSSDGEIRIGYQDSTRIYPVLARCTGANCTRTPTTCLTKANCAGISADSECNQGYCSNTDWVSAPAIELPADTGASPNAGYYTVQILDALDATNSLMVWLERALQPADDSGTTNVDRFAPLP